jgi:iron complex outermembrane receptor protein
MDRVCSLSSKFLLMVALLLPLSLWAQTATLIGQLTDQSGEPLIGITVRLDGTSIGTTSDLDGNYTLSGIEPGTYSVVYSAIGYKTQTREWTANPGQSRTMSMAMEESVYLLNETVVVGYGTTQSKDLTGSVVSVSSEDFQEGNIATPEQLVSGKVAGLRITSNSGMPGAGSRIRIRGGTSLNASNDPLIVIDGVPVDNGGISGSGNALNLINPDDIENISVLKDASAAAIYGSRAANGVIIITTKDGAASKKLKVGFTTTNGIGQIVNYAPVLNASQYSTLINEQGTTSQIGLLGTENTDWQREIYQSAWSTDNDLTLSGGLENLPYRLSLEYYRNDGLLKTSSLERTGLALNLSPKVLDDRLSIDVNGRFAYTQNQFADAGAIGSAVRFDPTQPVFSGSDEFGGFYEWIDPSTGQPNVLAPRNPLGLLEQKEDLSDVFRFIGNVQLDYEMPFLESLHANLNLGTDIARSSGTVFIPAEAASSFNRGGVDDQYDQEKDNRLLEFFLNYKEEYASIKSRVDLTAGYSYQNWQTFSDTFPSLNVAGDIIVPTDPFPFETENTLISFFGRLNYTYAEKYLLTLTLRNDGSSRFSPDTRWGLFPSAAFAWRISEEGFLAGAENLSNLKLRLGYGVTGQQDVFSDYPYIANYTQGTLTAQYQFGDVFYNVLRPDGYDPNIKWEETTSYNVGLDIGFNNNRYSATVDFYHKDTEDLLATVPIPAGTNFTNQILTNVGSLTNTGLEATVNVVAIDKGGVFLEFGANATYNRNEITQLNTLQNDEEDPGVLVGGIAGGVGNTIQIHTVGFPTFSFYVYEQLYDEDGTPLQGEYADLNGDGVITPDDRYRFKQPDAQVFAGFYGNVKYNQWNAGFTMRAEFGNYLYNNVNSNTANFAATGGTTGSLTNLVDDYFNTEFTTAEFLSDYYVEDASFLRMDNIYLGYDFGKIANDKASLRMSLVAQNVFVISNYSGLDPEIAGGIDNNIFPRPRTYSISLTLDL